MFEFVDEMLSVAFQKGALVFNEIKRLSNRLICLSHPLFCQ